MLAVCRAGGGFTYTMMTAAMSWRDSTSAYCFPAPESSEYSSTPDVPAASSWADLSERE